MAPIIDLHAKRHSASRALELLDALRLYRDTYGFHALPVRSDKTPDLARLPLQNGKPEWHSLQERLATDEEIIAWAQAYGVAIVPTDEVVIIDLDEGHRESLGSAHPLPATPCVRTPHGFHLYFAAPDVPVANKAAILPHVDVRSRGGYAIAPPSPGYAWVDGLSLADLPLAPLPDWVVEKAPSPYSRPEPPCASNYIKLLAQAQRAPISPLVLFGPTQGEDLLALVTDPGFVVAAMPLLGIPAVPVGRAFHCVLPGHTDRKPSAALWRNPVTGQTKYHDLHGVDGQEWYSLADVLAARAYGHAKILSKSEMVTWQLRLLVETGVVRPARVPMPKLPKHLSSPDVQRVYDGFRLLLGARWLHSSGEPAPFTWKFARAWCGVPEHRAGAAIQALLKQGVIRKAGEHKRVTLFLPGE